MPTKMSGAAVVKWINRLPCKPGLAGSIPGFTSLSDETLNRGPISIIMTLAVGGTLNTNTITTKMNNFMFKWLLCLDNLKIKLRSYYNHPNSAF